MQHVGKPLGSLVPAKEGGEKKQNVELRATRRLLSPAFIPELLFPKLIVHMPMEIHGEEMIKSTFSIRRGGRKEKALSCRFWLSKSERH